MALPWAAGSLPLRDGDTPVFAESWYKPALDITGGRHELKRGGKAAKGVERRPTLVRNFAIAGFILAELYMVFSDFRQT